MSTLRITENRTELRYAGAGAVSVWPEDSPAGEIEGRLVDVSAGGFRMAHWCAWLAAGETVEFAHAEAAGRARVVWTRIASGRVETGFQVMEEGGRSLPAARIQR